MRGVGDRKISGSGKQGVGKCGFGTYEAARRRVGGGNGKWQMENRKRERRSELIDLVGGSGYIANT